MGERKLDECATITQSPYQKSEDASNNISISTELIEKVLAKSKDDDVIRSVLEANSAANLIASAPEKTIDNPFDPIYFSTLQPDLISKIDYGTIMRFSDIQDLSHEVEFDDGLDND